MKAESDRKGERQSCSILQLYPNTFQVGLRNNSFYLM